MPTNSNVPAGARRGLMLPVGTYVITSPMLVRGDVPCVVEGSAELAAQDEVDDPLSGHAGYKRHATATTAQVRREGIRPSHRDGA